MELYDSDEDDEASKTQVVGLSSDMDKIYAELSNIRNEYAKLEKREKSVEVKAEGGTSKEEVKKLKVKPLQAPSFDGDIRQYPSFKRDYQAHMAKFYGEDAFALKSCLTGDALQLVQPVDDDYREMFKRLDFRYGRPEKLVDTVLNELKNLKKVEEHDSKKFVQMVDIVERCYLDLKKVGMESEMNTASMLGQFEKKLPANRMHEWALLKQEFRTDPP